ncbi:HAMP domain-containing histidine kinase [Nocardioides seonyuensis]|uniref:histidine kinase n=1 Tax=Nocardioides seonyuensis TaxID=2518371 RepID=A0A4P7IHL9_9ACTN|nr:HAMP domain-containing sensor histidine kinase [Nocardioides seonyuensis]QBX55291.1 HAMP domain-containing histidine kinase [Nocardioides seonyuensis]
MNVEWQRPRAHAWGGDPERAALLAIAEDIRSRAGFKVCAVEVLRADRMLEFVAIAGADDEGRDLLGQASPVDAMHAALSLGADYGAFTFVAGEWMTDEASELMARYGHVPELPPANEPDAWLATDMLAARIVDAQERLRGIVYLDEPLSGRRPTPEQISELGSMLALQLRAILTHFDREQLEGQLRVARSASAAIRSMSSERDLGGFLKKARHHLKEGFRASDLQIRLFDGGHELNLSRRSEQDVDPRHHRLLDEAAQRAWSAQTALIVEPGHVWGDEILAREGGEDLDLYLARLGAAAVVLVPIGAADEALGYVWVVRHDVRWTEAESIAALSAGHDLGRAVVNARAFAREEQLVGELQRLDQYRTQLIATITHEMKNPIGALAGHLELIDMQLEDGLQVPEAIVRSLSTMSRSVDRLSALASSLLELTRLGQSDTPLVRRPVDLGDLVAEVAALFEAQARAAGVELTFDADSGSVVTGDAAELEMLVTNLVSNAVKYTEPGGSADVTVRRDGDRAVLTCADSGIGITPADQDLVFGEFHRSGDPRARQRPGSGLGLSIAKRIVERHRGTISVTSEHGNGSVFTVRLPLAGPEDHPGPT